MAVREFLLSAILLTGTVASFATDRVSVASGSWATAGTWNPAGIPAAGDNLTIASGHIVSVGGNGSCSSLTINGTLDWSANNKTVSAGGNLVLNNGSSITGTGGTGTLNVTGTLTVSPSATVTIAKVNLSITGATAISGTVTFNNTSGAKTFSDLTLNTGATWNCTAAVPFTINGNFVNNGTFTANTGVYTFGGASKSFSGSSATIFNSISVTGTYTNNASLQVNVNIATSGGFTQGANSTLIIGDPTPTGNLTATASGNTVKYLISSGNQSIYAVTYQSLIFENTGSGSISATGTYTVNANIDALAGSCSLSNVTVNGNLNVASGATVTIGNASPVIKGTTTVDGNLSITSTTGTKTFNDVIVSSTGTWNSTVAEAYAITGSLTNNGTFTANTGTYTFSGSGKTFSGTLSIPTATVTGSYTNNATFTSTTSLTGTGAFTQGGSATLNLTAATFGLTTFNASASGNTVNYNLAGNQNVVVPSDGAYHHLSVGGSGTKTLQGATAVNGDLTISAGVLTANNFNINLKGNWSNSGTFTPGTNTVTLNGTGAQTITKSGGETFNHLSVAGSGTKTLGSDITTNGDMTISSTLDVSSSSYSVTVKGNWTNNGTFTQGSGTVTFNGASAQTIGGSTTTDFNNITQSNAAGVSLTHAQNLIGTLTISSGTFTTTGYTFTLKSTSTGTARIAAIPGGANFAGNISMQRYTGTGPTAWRFLSPAVSGATIADWADDFATSGFTGSTDPGNSFVSIYSYDETASGTSDNGYVAATNVTNTISNGKGFWVYLGPNPKTFTVSGPPKTFSQVLPVSYTSSSGGSSNDGWNLIANPYPSAIDWSSASWTKTNLDNAIYIYNSSTGSYASYVAGVGVNGGSQYIASQQAFWVKANAASPAITGVESVKASSNPSHLKQAFSPNISRYPMAFRDYPVPLNATTRSNSIRLTVSGNGRQDEMYIQFMPGASNGFDPAYDAWKLEGDLNPNLATVLNDSVDLSINSLPDLNSNVTIPIRLKVPSSGTYSIRRDSLLLLPLSSCVFLEDLATGSLVDLRSKISYSFTISDTTKAPRFVLHVYAPLAKKEIQPVCAGDSGGIAIVTGTGSGPWDYHWTDSYGHTLRTTTASYTSDSLLHLPSGIYTVEVSGSVCGLVKDTFRIQSSSTLAVMANYSNVSCSGLNDGSAYTTVSGGQPPFYYHWSNDATGASVQNLVPGNYSVTVTDAAGCSQTQFVIISQPAPLSAGFSVSSDTVNLSLGNSVSFSNLSQGAFSYSWDFGDSALPDTSANPVHYFNYPGTFAVKLVASNGTCRDTARRTIVVISDTGMVTGTTAPSGRSSLRAWYSDGRIVISPDLPEGANAAIRVYNLVGEIVLSRPVVRMQHQALELPFESSPGIYFIAVETPDKILSGKIFVGRN